MINYMNQEFVIKLFPKFEIQLDIRINFLVFSINRRKKKCRNIYNIWDGATEESNSF